MKIGDIVNFLICVDEMKQNVCNYNYLKYACIYLCKLLCESNESDITIQLQMLKGLIGVSFSLPDQDCLKKVIAFNP